MKTVRVNWNRMRTRLPDSGMTTIAVPKALLPNIKRFLEILSKEGKGFSSDDVLRTIDISHLVTEKEDPRQLRLF